MHAEVLELTVLFLCKRLEGHDVDGALAPLERPGDGKVGDKRLSRRSGYSGNKIAPLKVARQHGGLLSGIECSVPHFPKSAKIFLRKAAFTDVHTYI